jgi:hypothetical protein
MLISERRRFTQKQTGHLKFRRPVCFWGTKTSSAILSGGIINGRSQFFPLTLLEGPHIMGHDAILITCMVTGPRLDV